MGERLIIYGAGGFSGRLIARRAHALGLEPVVCGRDAGKLRSLADELGTQCRGACVGSVSALDRAFADARVVINAAGPFTDTAAAVSAACLRARAHYLDITAEVPVIESLARAHEDARRAGVMIMPAVGFDVVPSDCLALALTAQLGRVRRLAVAVTGLGFLTRGSAKTLVRFSDGGLVRRNGELMAVELGTLERSFDFGAGPRPTLNVSLGDLATARYTTGAVDIETYVDATPLIRSILLGARACAPFLRFAPLQATLSAMADALPEDPTAGREGEAASRTMTVVVEAQSDGGERATARVHTPEAYAFTGLSAAEIARRVLAGDFESGFQTPARVFGSDFVFAVDGVHGDAAAAGSVYDGNGDAHAARPAAAHVATQLRETATTPELRR